YQNPLRGLRLDITSGANVAEKLIEADVFHFTRIRTRAQELLESTEIPRPYMDRTPRSLSGGMQQRIQIAKALANNPPLVLLDEVTSGLDVSVQARVLDLVRELQRERGISMIVVSHDMGVIRLLADRTLVMKNGCIVERGLTDQILEDPQHPYTQLLVHSTL
ncbi:MAG TPA: ATP-binding cassette domain-containing protein, partial [Spirochaetia bacterium]